VFCPLRGAPDKPVLFRLPQHSLTRNTQGFCLHIVQTMADVGLDGGDFFRRPANIVTIAYHRVT
jgi:hypothetical protein